MNFFYFYFCILNNETSINQVGVNLKEINFLLDGSERVRSKVGNLKNEVYLVNLSKIYQQNSLEVYKN